MGSKLAAWVYSILPERGALMAVALASFFIYHATTTVLAWRRLRHFPGPPLASISNFWSFFTVAGGQCHVKIAREQKKYGKAMRIGPNAIMVYDPETLWHINSARSLYSRSGWYESQRFHPEGESVFSEVSTVLHDKRKAKLVSGFAGKGSVNLEADVDSQIAALVKYIRTKALYGQADRLAFSKVLRWFQLDLITLIGLVPLIHSISVVPFMRKITISKLFVYLAWPKVTDKEGLGRSISQMRSIVKHQFENITENKAGHQHGNILSEWIKHGHNIKQCELDLAILMPAGTETSITTVRGTLLHILSSPAVYHKLKQEISEGIKAGRISQPITQDQAKEMPYLQAVIREGMRIVPPVINGFAKKVPPSGDTICGKFVPGGTEVHMNFIAMLMNTEVFGADAEVFRPERFLECDEKQRNYMLKTIDLSFGYGRWLCLGKPLAILELNKIYVELLRVFDFQITQAEKPWKRRGYSTSIIDDFELRVRENPLD
ncbi:putative cytochrome p450 monooxygenase [Diaporthe ampelina]|uniref:Putative cytochrome p450 monooxygenase n=1 Tax=Diaporthe ampelina TaxID=1214573 RepID=A0A0G2HCL4_9PEZI|nr:putative cytochrome p450 monooxygenase [Diaporthe ampelina]